MKNVTLIGGLSVVVSFMIGASGGANAQAREQRRALDSARGLQLHNVAAAPATLGGKTGLRVTLSDEARRDLDAKTADERQRYTDGSGAIEMLAVLDGIEFHDGVIEAEIAGSVAPGFETTAARGFVGLAFRLQGDMRTYDAFYLRPTNGRSDDQVRRNHSVQYIAHPDWPWYRLRKEFPKKYESYVDLVPGEWTKVKIEAHGTEARLYVHDQAQPTLLVHDLKSGADGKGSVALWIQADTVAHFRNVVVTPQ